MDENKYYETTYKIAKAVLCASTAMVVVACASKLVPVQKNILFKTIKGIGLYGIGLRAYDAMRHAIDRNSVTINVK